MTTRTFTTDQAGPVQLDAELVTGRIRVTAVAGLTHAEITIHTIDTEGPSHAAVERAELGPAGGGRIVARVTDPGGGMHQGAVNIAAGNAQVGMQVAGVVHGGMHQTVAGVSTSSVVGGSVVVIDARVPEGSRLSARTRSGNIATSGALRTVIADTVSGDVQLVTVEQATLETVSGDITVEQLTGRAVANTRSGDIRVHGGVDSSLRADSGSGDIVATGGLAITAHTAAGQVRTR